MSLLKWYLYSVMTRAEMLKVSLARKALSVAKGAQVTFLISSMFSEETVKLKGYWSLLLCKKVSACVVGHICYLSLLIGLGALLIEFEIGCKIFWENSRIQEFNLFSVLQKIS